MFPMVFYSSVHLISHFLYSVIFSRSQTTRLQPNLFHNLLPTYLFCFFYFPISSIFLLCFELIMNSSPKPELRNGNLLYDLLLMGGGLFHILLSLGMVRDSGLLSGFLGIPQKLLFPNGSLSFGQFISPFFLTWNLHQRASTPAYFLLFLSFLFTPFYSFYFPIIAIYFTMVIKTFLS